MYDQKMKENDNSVIEFIEKVENIKKRKDAYDLLDIFTEVTGFQPKMWGPSIIGFGSYHYIYKSGHEGDAPLVGFSPRKAKISLYFTMDEIEREKLLESLGKHTSGKGCVYINKLADVDIDIIKKLIVHSVNYLEQKYPSK